MKAKLRNGLEYYINNMFTKYMRKEELAQKSKEHYNKMKSQFENESKTSISNSILYREIICNPIKDYDTTYFFEQLTTTDAASKYSSSEYINRCLLNFASYTRPGGGFLKGSIAQEECLCRDSNLYNVLEHFTDEYNYNYQEKMFNEGLYYNFAIYSPDIKFIDTKDNSYIFDYDVITCAAPNKGVYDKYNTDFQKYYNELKKRIEFVLNIAYENCVETLILGAFGCGVFKNDPNIVAQTFKDLLPKYGFKNVIFAIPDMNKLDIFKNVFNK